MKICIASKDRVSLASSVDLFKGYEVILFVEPMEYEAYKLAYPGVRIIDIGQSNRGLAFVRNYIKDFMGDERFILADDDIKEFRKVSGNRPGTSFKKHESFNDIPAVMEEVKKMFDMGHALVGFNQTPSLWTAKDEYQVNRGSLIQFIGIDGKKLHHIRYDETLRQISDLYILVAMLYDGKTSYIRNNFISCSADLQTPGGQTFTRKEQSYREGLIAFADHFKGTELEPYILFVETFRKKKGVPTDKTKVQLKISYKKIDALGKAKQK